MERLVDKREVVEVLRHVYDPNYADRSIVDMGLVTESDIIVTRDAVVVTYRAPSRLRAYDAALGVMIGYILETRLAVVAKVKSSHAQSEEVTEILSNPVASAELVRQLEQSGILWHCVHF